MKNLFLQLHIILLIYFGFNATLAQMVKVEIEEITIKSHLVIKGIVSNKWSEFEEDGKSIITFIEFSVSETIKGSSKQIVSIVIPGGVVGDVGMGVSHTPQFYLGEKQFLPLLIISQI